MEIRICGLISAENNEEIISVCKENNKDLKISEAVFRLPLHVLVKEPFETDDYERVRDTVSTFLYKKGPLRSEIAEVIKTDNKIFLRLKGEVTEFSKELDDLLYDSFKIDKCELNLDVMLFADDNDELISEMYHRLSSQINSKEIIIDRFVISSSGSGDYYIDLK